VTAVSPPATPAVDATTSPLHAGEYTASPPPPAAAAVDTSPQLNVRSDAERLADAVASDADLPKLLARLQEAEAAREDVAARLMAADAGLRGDGGGEELAAEVAVALGGGCGVSGGGSDTLGAVPLGIVLAATDALPTHPAAATGRTPPPPSQPCSAVVVSGRPGARVTAALAPPTLLHHGRLTFPTPDTCAALGGGTEHAAAYARRRQVAASPVSAAAAVAYRDALARARRINDAALDAAGLDLVALIATCCDAAVAKVLTATTAALDAAVGDVAAAVVDTL